MGERSGSAIMPSISPVSIASASSTIRSRRANAAAPRSSPASMRACISFRISLYQKSFW